MLTWEVDPNLPVEIEISFDAPGLGSLLLARSGESDWVARNSKPDGSLEHELKSGEFATFAIATVGFTGDLPVTVAVKQRGKIVPAYIRGEVVNRDGAGYGPYRFPELAPYKGEINLDFDVVSR